MILQLISTNKSTLHVNCEKTAITDWVTWHLTQKKAINFDMKKKYHCIPVLGKIKNVSIKAQTSRGFCFW